MIKNKTDIVIRTNERTTSEHVGVVLLNEVSVVPRGGRIESVEGLVSIDRSVVAALLSTTPRA